MGQPLGTPDCGRETTSKVTHCQACTLVLATDWEQSRLATRGYFCPRGSLPVTWALTCMVSGSQEIIWRAECCCFSRLEAENSGSITSTILYCLNCQRAPSGSRGRDVDLIFHCGECPVICSQLLSATRVNYDCLQNFFYNIRLQHSLKWNL